MAKTGNRAKNKRGSCSVGSPVRHILVMFVCLAGMALSLFFFREDMNESLRLFGRKPIGTVYRAGGSSMRLPARRLQWERFERNSPVYDGDVFSTAALSDLKITFINGETLELSENTSVALRYPDGGSPEFQLNGGEIQVQSGKDKLLVFITPAFLEGVSAAPEAELNPGTSAGIKISGGFDFKVYQGSGLFSTPGETRTVTAGEALKLDSNLGFLPDPQVMMLSPRNGTRLLRGGRGSAPVEFRWQPAKSVPFETAAAPPGFKLELAGSRDFSTLVESRPLEGDGSLEIDLSPGTYYWRLLTPEGGEADSGKLEIVPTTSPLALFPPDDSTQKYLSEKRDLRFSWEVPGEAEAIMLEVADNPGMARPRLRQLVRRTKNSRGYYINSGLEPGRWYWRVHPVYPGGVAEQEDAFRALGAASGNAQNFWRVRQIYAGIMAADESSPVNSFVLIDSVETFPSPAKTAKLFSDTETGIPPRPVFPPENHTIEANRTPDLIFAWRNARARAGLRFQIAKRPDFTNAILVDEEVPGSPIRGPYLEPGVYYWRIAHPGLMSAINLARLVVRPGLTPPELRSPGEYERFHIEKGVPVEFSWNRVDYADYYRFSLYLDGRELPLLEVSPVQGTLLKVYFDPNTTGRFRWTIQGFTPPTEITPVRNGLISEGHFYISPESGMLQEDSLSWERPRIAIIHAYAGEVNSPITLLAPVSGVNIPGIQALRSPPEVRWTSDVPLKNMQLIVSRTTDPSSDPRAIVKDIDSGRAIFPSLTEGIWYWIIRGDTTEWRGATPGDPFWFNVLPIPLLPVPRQLEPVSGTAITIAQLTRDKRISFRWNAVSGANAYIFSLYQVVDGRSPTLVTAGVPQTSLSCVFDDLHLLAGSDYLWQVEAVYRNRNGVIEQRGRTVLQPFTIDVRSSGSLQIRTQGTTYGQ